MRIQPRREKAARSGLFSLLFRAKWLRGLDLNQRPLGYESDKHNIFNKLENTDSTVNHGKEA
jgi:hypothetical protein